MEQAFNNISSLSIASSKDLTEAEQKIKKYEPLLYQIAISFGFSKNESWELVQHACLLAYHSYAKQEISCPLKIFVTKGLVHRCIFKVSSQLFCQSATAKPYDCQHTRELHLQRMPLNLRAVYLLHIQFKFNEVEISEILNTTHMQVKEKLYRALTYIKTH